MEKQKNEDQIIRLHTVNEQALDSINRKADELISLLETTDLNENDINNIRKRLNSVLSGPESDEKIFQKIKQPDEKNLSRANKANNLEQLLQANETDSRRIKHNNLARGATSIIRVITALLLIVLGFGMIIMPAPPYFEMFTLFYINPNDGVTIMDVISLIVGFTGVSLFISAIVKFK